MPIFWFQNRHFEDCSARFSAFKGVFLNFFFDLTNFEPIEEPCDSLEVTESVQFIWVRPAKCLDEFKWIFTILISCCKIEQDGQKRKNEIMKLLKSFEYVKTFLDEPLMRPRSCHQVELNRAGWRGSH